MIDLVRHAKLEGCGLRPSSPWEPRLHPIMVLPSPTLSCSGPPPAIPTSLCPSQISPRPGQGKEAGSWAQLAPRGHRVIEGPYCGRCDWNPSRKNQPVCHRQALVRAHTCKIKGDGQSRRKMLKPVPSSLVGTRASITTRSLVHRIYKSYMHAHTRAHMQDTHTHTQPRRGCQVLPG